MCIFRTSHGLLRNLKDCSAEPNHTQHFRDLSLTPSFRLCLTISSSQSTKVISSSPLSMSLPPSPEALDVALQSISKTAFRPSRGRSVCFTVPSPNPSLCFSAPLTSGHSYSSSSDLRLHSPEDRSQSEGNWVLTDRDGPDGNNLEVVHDDPFKTSKDSDRFDQEDFADEKLWVPVDASSPEASICSDLTEFGSRSPPLPSRPRSATDPLMLLSPCVLPSPFLSMGTP